MALKRHAPCGCNWRSERIMRAYRILFPTVFVECACGIHKETWTERYEFEFSVPISGKTWEAEKRAEE
jgi:hypothetical protein